MKVVMKVIDMVGKGSCLAFLIHYDSPIPPHPLSLHIPLTATPPTPQTTPTHPTPTHLPTPPIQHPPPPPPTPSLHPPIYHPPIYHTPPNTHHLPPPIYPPTQPPPIFISHRYPSNAASRLSSALLISISTCLGRSTPR